MKKFMPQIHSKLTLFLSLFVLISCNDQKPAAVSSTPPSFKELRQGVTSDSLDSVRRFNLAHHSGRIIKTVLLVSAHEHEVGLSGTKSDEFAATEGALFWYPSEGVRRFWMPDTYFNLDLVFLDAQLKIVDIDRNLQAHPGRQEPPPIQFSRSVFSRHVLEVRADSDTAKALKIGDQLRILPPLNLSQIESKIHQQQ